ncbi:amidohydrolase family protein [Terracoccus luteus]|uniref:Putative TIM-barrel fold metal-dependent hydrolase n=1 Tax=Terracoccus luteus TaxID=53356 RepID=A0A839PYC0_9MICO|nr:amidohydrolase family protein [Terracoccus luteus]MBB2988527.1 putative TIM-barrel fold metal-dependent hydrolase [Terracoccus luteus]MCP2174177.1 putative TIM-barrel fold metal-dependent hydrolase [Terracoccus luteus]
MSADDQASRLISADSHLEVPITMWCPRKLLDDLRRSMASDTFATRVARSYLGAVEWRPDGELPDWEVEGDGPSFSAEDRVSDMDLDGVAAEVLYPALAFDLFAASTFEPSLTVDVASTYNDWLSNYCTPYQDRLWGMAVVPHAGAELAVAEASRAARLPGIRGISFQQWPAGNPRIGPEDDLFWSWASKSGVPITFHIGVGGGLGAERGSQVTSPAYLLAPFAGHTEYVVAQFIVAGVFDRFPQLRIAVGETGVGWISFFCEQMDLNYQRLRWSGAVPNLDKLPSDYVREHFLFVMQEDRFGLRTAGAELLRHAMWGSDYPHTVTNWPASQRLMGEQLTSVPPDIAERIRWRNAVEFYGSR